MLHLQLPSHPENKTGENELFNEQRSYRGTVRATNRENRFASLSQSSLTILSPISIELNL